MTENYEPVAQAPETPTYTPAPTAPAATSPAAARSISLRSAMGVVALAAVAGLGGFAVGNHNDTIRPVGHMEQFGNQQPGQMMPGGPQQGNGQMMPGGPMQGDGRGFGMGPHCEDASGNHAAVNADGTCPTGFTLDDKGRMGSNTQPAPAASPATSS